MNITKKYLYITLASFILLGILGLLINPVTALCIVDGIFISLILGDYMLSHGQMNLQVICTKDEKLSINEKENMTFEVYNNGTFPITAVLLDEIPDYHFEAPAPEMTVTIQPKEKAEVKYEIIPRKRGDYTFENIYMKVTGRLGLYSEYIKIPLKREYKVYPNLQILKKYRMSVYKNMQEQQERKAIKVKAQGTAFESLREYVVGDEYKKINWAASARADKLIVNQYEPEKNQRIYAFIDAGRPMSYTIEGECKLDRAIDTALVLADTVTRNGDLAGLMCFNEKILDVVMPGKGSGHRDKLMETLYHIESNNATSNYEDAFLYFRSKERRKSLIFLFTDFDTYEEADIIAKAGAAAGRQNILVVILIKDLEIEEIATKPAVTPEEIYNKAAALDLLEERKRSIKRLNRKNIMCIETEPEKLETTVISRYIELKNRQSI